MARWRSTLGEFWKEPKHRSFCPHGVGHCHPPCRWMCCQTLRISVPCYSGVFMEVLSCEYHWLNHWLLMIKLILQPPSLSGAWGLSLKVQPSSHMIGSSGNQLPSWSSLGPTKSFLFSRKQTWLKGALHDWQETSFTCTTQLQGF